MASFIPPKIQDNPNGWGPNDPPDQFKDLPYAPFSKGDRLGKVIHRTEVILGVIHTFLSCFREGLVDIWVMVFNTPGAGKPHFYHLQTMLERQKRLNFFTGNAIQSNY